MITNNALSWKTRKIAVIDIKTPTYHKMRIKKIGNQKIYKQGIVKFKNWELDEECIKELIEFLKSPCDEIDKGLSPKNFCKSFSLLYNKRDKFSISVPLKIIKNICFSLYINTFKFLPFVSNGRKVPFLVSPKIRAKS